MADYSTKFSITLPLPSEAAQTHALNLAHKADSVRSGGEKPDDLPDSLMDVVEMWSFETEADQGGGKWGVWMHSEEGGVDAVCVFIQHLLQEFDPKGTVSFEWSNDCSKPTVDAYGGGAAIITAKKIKSMSTAEWLRSKGV